MDEDDEDAERGRETFNKSRELLQDRRQQTEESDFSALTLCRRSLPLHNSNRAGDEGKEKASEIIKGRRRLI